MNPPDPLTPPQSDLRKLPYMPLDVDRLRDADLSARVTGEEFRCAVFLWCASWHQVPAGSLPDDDVILAQFAGFGRTLDRWLECKAGAMHGWIKCSDGRFYHPVIAEKANDAWLSVCRHRHEQLCDRIRKKNRARVQAQQNPLTVPAFEAWYAMGCPSETELFPPERQPASGGNVAHMRRDDPPEPPDNSAGKIQDSSPPSAGIPPDFALNREGEVNLKPSSSSKLSVGLACAREAAPAVTTMNGHATPATGAAAAPYDPNDPGRWRDGEPGPGCNAPPDGEALRPAQITGLMRTLGIARASPADPRLVDAIREGVTLEAIANAVAKAREIKGKATFGPAYVLQIARQWAADGTLPDGIDHSAPKRRARSSNTWSATDAGMSAKAREVGIPDARPGESRDQFRARISEALDARGAA